MLLNLHNLYTPSQKGDLSKELACRSRLIYHFAAVHWSVEFYTCRFTAIALFISRGQ